MKKIVIVGAVTFGLMSFAQNNKGKENHGKGNQKEKHIDQGGVDHPGRGNGKEKGNKDKGNEKHEIVIATEVKKPGNSGKPKFDKNDKKEVKQKGEKGHPAHSNGNAYGKNKNGLSGREFGQHRAAQARSKHKPKNEAEAVSIITVIHEQNMTLLGRIKDKIEQVRDRLRERVRIGDLAQDIFESRQRRIDQLEKRRAEIAKALFSK